MYIVYGIVMYIPLVLYIVFLLFLIYISVCILHTAINFCGYIVFYPLRMVTHPCIGEPLKATYLEVVSLLLAGGANTEATDQVRLREE